MFLLTPDISKTFLTRHRQTALFGTSPVFPSNTIKAGAFRFPAAKKITLGPGSSQDVDKVMKDYNSDCYVRSVVHYVVTEKNASTLLIACKDGELAAIFTEENQPIAMSLRPGDKIFFERSKEGAVQTVQIWK